MVSSHPRKLTTTSKKKVIYAIISTLISTEILGGCNTGMSMKAFDPLGKWTERHGFSVSLHSNGKFEFCDNGHCAVGVYERPYGIKSYAVVLKNLFKFDNSKRLQSLIKKYDPYVELEGFPDLDFSANYGLLPDTPEIKYCQRPPCIIFGPVESFYEENRLVFEKAAVELTAPK